jgi:hypothetical protein
MLTQHHGGVLQCQMLRKSDKIKHAQDSIFFNLPTPSGLGFTQPVTEISTRNGKIMFLESRGRPVHRADNLTPSVS